MLFYWRKKSTTPFFVWQDEEGAVLVNRPSYRTNLSERQWEIIKNSSLPSINDEAGPRKICVRSLTPSFTCKQLAANGECCHTFFHIGEQFMAGLSVGKKTEPGKESMTRSSNVFAGNQEKRLSRVSAFWIPKVSKPHPLAEKRVTMEPKRWSAKNVM